MGHKEMAWFLFLLVVTVMVMTSLKHGSQAAPVEDCDQDSDRDKYCSDILLQTEDQEKNCAGAPHRFMSSSRSVIHLLCCLGAFPFFNVRHNYTNYLDTTLIIYIATNINCAEQEKHVAKFVVQCHRKISTNNPLNDEDFNNWRKHPSQCKA